MGMFVAMPIGRGVVAGLTRVGEIVLVKMKQPQQGQHKHQTRHHPGHGKVHIRRVRQNGVGYEVEESHAQHQPRHQAHHQLGSGVGHTEPAGQPTTQHAGHENGRHVDH